MSQLRLLAAFAALSLILLHLPSTVAQDAEVYQFDLGLRTELCDFPPLVVASGVNYVALDLLARAESYEEIPVVVGPVEEPPAAPVAAPSDALPAVPDASPPDDSAGEDSEGEAIAIHRAASAKPAAALPREFLFNGVKYALRASADGAMQLYDSQGRPLGSALVAHEGRIYLSTDALFAMGMALTYAPETGNMRLIGLLCDVHFDRLTETLRVTTLLPATAFSESVSEGFRVVLAGVFVKENREIELQDVGKTTLATRNLPQHRVELRCTQKTPTGYKLYTEPEAATFFRVHLGNHFDLVSYSRTSSGEISLNVAFTRPTDAKPMLLHSPNRLVLDFPGTIYDQATQHVEVNVGGVREVRVGQFSQDPPIVRVVVEMTRSLRYRVLRQGEGERYYVQLYTGQRSQAAIMLDAGHGGSDTGAIGITGVFEKDIALKVTSRLAESLRNRGYGVVLTRDRDRFVSLGARADLCNELLPMIFVSIHANWIDDPLFTGVMTFHYEGSLEAGTLSHIIQRHLVSSTGAVDRQVRGADFFVLRETVVPAVLVEVGFLTNVGEEYKLRDPIYQGRIVDGLVSGIDEYMQAFGGY